MFRAHGLYGHIRNNNAKSAALMAGFTVFLVMLWFAGCLAWSAMGLDIQAVSQRLQGAHPTTVSMWLFAWHHGVALTLSLAYIPVGSALVWFAIAYHIHADVIRAGTGAHPVYRFSEPALYNMVETLAITAGLPMPKVEIVETDALNAYASGWGPRDAVIAVTRGLMLALSKDELEAVIAHEMTHIKYRDVRLMVVASIFVGILGFGSRMLGGSGNSNRSRGAALHGAGTGGIPVVMVAMAVAGLAALFGLCSRFAVSRAREFVADAGAVELTKNPEALIGALQKIAGCDALPGLPAPLKIMMISVEEQGWFSTHPSVESRIAALEVHARVHAPHSRRVVSASRLRARARGAVQ